MIRIVLCILSLFQLCCSSVEHNHGEYVVTRHYKLKARERSSVSSMKQRELRQTIAFIQPSECMGKGEERSLTRFKMVCRDLMNELELAAEKNGFKVVHWRELARSPDPLVTASSKGIDLLIEVSSEIPSETEQRQAPDLELVSTQANTVQLFRDRQKDWLPYDQYNLISACEQPFAQLKKGLVPAQKWQISVISTQDRREVLTVKGDYHELEDHRGRITAQYVTRVRSIRTDTIKPYTATLVIGAVLMTPNRLQHFQYYKSKGSKATFYQISDFVGLAFLGAAAVLYGLHDRVVWPDPDHTFCRGGSARWFTARSRSGRRSFSPERRFAQEFIQRLKSSAYLGEVP